MARKKYVITPKSFEEPNNRVFLDPFWVNEAYRKDQKVVINCLESCVNKGSVLVTTASILDMLIFQKNLPYLDVLVTKDYLIPEYQDTPTEIAERLFYWSCAEKITAPAATLEYALKDFPNKASILAIRDHVSEYAKLDGTWEKGDVDEESGPLTETMKKELGLTATATRSEVMIACLDKDKPGMRESYNARHIRRLAELHRCDKVFYADGSVNPRV